MSSNDGRNGKGPDFRLIPGGERPPKRKPNTNQSHQLIIEDRRREVATLRRRRLSIRQIVAALEAAGRVNPRTGRPWNVATIKADLDYLQEAARAEALREISEHKAEILADYHELMRLAWAERRYEDVRRILKDVRDLLGTDAPQVVLYEQVAQHMHDAISRLEAAFRDDPTALDRALAALMGGDYQGPPASSLN